MDFVLFLSSILLLKSAELVECRDINDRTSPAPLLRSAMMEFVLSDANANVTTNATTKNIKETIDKSNSLSEVSSRGSSDPMNEVNPLDIPIFYKRESLVVESPTDDTSIILSTDETVELNQTTDAGSNGDEGNHKKPLIIDLGSLPIPRVRRTNEFLESKIADQEVDDPVIEPEDSSFDETLADQEFKEDSTDLRQERNLNSDETFDGAERRTMYDGWYHQQPFLERRSPN
ncbi:uncharacterized protein LOC116424155 [Nomia melanderi]|uniref:uncharacterized protein LOC116424155 n=1 Tax=Nomia melanderi TaxID=2448451 RepID=UPI0013044B15|nr:uncharacterized protein LOC116424155 [Nomia melanderi]